MRKWCLGIAVLALSVNCGLSAAGQYAEDALLIQSPRFTVSLTSDEFGALTRAADAGLCRYGGDVLYRVHARHSVAGTVWEVIVESPVMIEVMEHWLDQNIVDLVGLLDLRGEISKTIADSLDAAKRARTRVHASRSEPIWAPRTLDGILAREGEAWSISCDVGRVLVDVSNVAPGFEAMEGKRVVATGAVRIPGRFDAVSLVEAKTNTIQLFVMSLCPYGMEAEVALIDRMLELERDEVPKLSIHYIFYRSGDGNTFTSMHGMEEVHEDVVQMVLRDNYPPETYWAYLRARSESESSWRDVVLEIGLSLDAVELIAQQVIDDGPDLVRREYEYVAGACRIYDGSPTMLWEGKIVSDWDEVPFVSGMTGKVGTCSTE